MVASPAFSEPKHRLYCFQNKSEKQSKSYCFGSGLLQNRYTSVFKNLTRVRHVLLHFSRFKTFLFFGHSKIKVRSCVLCVYAGTLLAVKYRDKPGRRREQPCLHRDGVGAIPAQSGNIRVSTVINRAVPLPMYML